jgi:hypothetical protein
MTLSYKHIGLIIGIALVFVSFLFTGRQQGTYQILLLGGLATAFIFYLTILFGKGQKKVKIFWAVLIVVCAVLEQLIEPFLVNTSYHYYISRNQSTLAETNKILQHKNGDIFILNDSITANADTLTLDEKAKLKKGRKELGVYMISKSDKGIHYGLWGFLDVRLGITYLPTKEHTGGNYMHLTGNWFRLKNGW